MQPWLQPTQASTSAVRPWRAFSTRSGSAISARVMPTASASPEAIRRSAAATSTIRVAPITGTLPTAARISASGAAIAASGAGGGGAIQLDAAT